MTEMDRSGLFKGGMKEKLRNIICLGLLDYRKSPCGVILFKERGVFKDVKCIT